MSRILLVVTLLAAPLAFGAVQAWAWATLNLLAVLLLLLWGIGCAQQGRLEIAWSPLYVPAALFLLLGLGQFLGHVTYDPFSTREALLKLTTDLILFFLAGQLMATASEKAWTRLGLAVSVYAFAMSLFAILQFLSSPGLIYWSVKPRWGGWIFGPYVNHNHYAGLMEMLIPLSLGYALPEEERGFGVRGKAQSTPQSFQWLLGFAIVVPVASVLLSGSRGGFIALLVEGFVLGVVIFGPARASIGRMLAAKVGLAVAVVAVIFFWMDTAGIGNRLATVFQPMHSPEATFGQRHRVTLDSLRILRDHPWTGTGFGSFETAYPRYQSFPGDQVWDHAHNDYAEALAETGLAGGLLILAALALFFPLAFGRLRERLRQPAGWIKLGAAVGCCGLLVHSLFDFNLHIPANAAWFAAWVALATTAMFTTETQRHREKSRS